MGEKGCCSCEIKSKKSRKRYALCKKICSVCTVWIVMIALFLFLAPRTNHKCNDCDFAVESSFYPSSNEHDTHKSLTASAAVETSRPKLISIFNQHNLPGLGSKGAIMVIIGLAILGASTILCTLIQVVKHFSDTVHATYQLEDDSELEL